jgi:hypothetical protein
MVTLDQQRHVVVDRSETFVARLHARMAESERSKVAGATSHD